MEFDFEKLGKEIVIGRLKDAADPYPLAGEVVLKIATAAVTSTREKQDPHTTVAAACRGVVGGMLLLEKDLPQTAVAILMRIGELAQEAHLDPADCMTWAMEGIAAVCRIAPGKTADDVSRAIEERFMGAGDIFSNLARTAGA